MMKSEEDHTEHTPKKRGAVTMLLIINVIVFFFLALYT